MSYEQRVLADIATSLDHEHERRRRKQQQQQQQQQQHQQQSAAPIVPSAFSGQEPMDMRPKQVTRGFNVDSGVSSSVASQTGAAIRSSDAMPSFTPLTMEDKAFTKSRAQNQAPSFSGLYPGIPAPQHISLKSKNLSTPGSLQNPSMSSLLQPTSDPLTPPVTAPAENPFLNANVSPSPLSTSQKHATSRAPGAPRQQVPSSLRFDDQKKRLQVERRLAITRKKSQKEIPLFSHLQQYEKDHLVTENIRNVHPAVIQVGLKFKDGVLTGANSRCVATLEALKLVIRDYVTPPSQVLKRHLDTHIKPMITYLVQFRPMAISMGNAIRFLRTKIATLEPDMSEMDAKTFLCDCIDSFINERIVLADQVISSSGISKINDGDVILTYAKSSVVQKTLLEAHKQKRRFRVVIIDAGPKFEGKLQVEALLQAGIECTYTLMNGVSYIMNEVSKVFLGAHGMYSNGTLIARAGTAIVAMMARSRNVPVMVCCETYKFSDRVQLDAFVFNELGDPDDLVMVKGKKSERLAGWRDIPPLKLLNLVYDVTPAEYINMVITEIGMIPCTSVPVVLREYHSQWSI